MKIKRVINNNTVMVADDKEREIILRGIGIGFRRKSGDDVDMAQIEKWYARFDETQVRHFQRLAEEIPYEYMHMTSEIISYAQISLNKELDENLYIALLDHLNFAISRIQKGIELKNSMLWEIKHYYNHEYKIGLEALALIKQYAKVDMPEDEAGFIAMHILNAEMDLDMGHSTVMTRLIQDVINIVRYHFHIAFEEDSLDSERFITHLKFFIQRSMHNKKTNAWDDELQNMIRTQYLEAYKCAQKIASYIISSTLYAVPEEEVIYLTVHIQRLQMAAKKV